MASDNTIGPGTALAHSSGSVCVVEMRKGDDTGWWVYGGGGVADWALETDDWQVLDRQTVASLWERLESLEEIRQRIADGWKPIPVPNDKPGDKSVWRCPFGSPDVHMRPGLAAVLWPTTEEEQ